MSGRLSLWANSSTVKLLAAGGVAVGAVALMVNGAPRSQPALPRPTGPAALQFERQFGRPDPNLHPASASDYIDKLALASGGDWSRLSSEDQRYVNSVTAGHGAIYLRDHAAYLKKHAPKKHIKAKGSTKNRRDQRSETKQHD